MLTLRKVRPLLEQQGKLFGMMVQIINGVAKFRVAGAESRAFAYWGRQYSRQLKLMLSSQQIEDNLAVINNILPALTSAALFGFATSMLQQSQANGGNFSTGTFLAFNAAFGTFISGATSLSTTVVDVLEVLPLWQRAQPILHATPEVDAFHTDPGRWSRLSRLDISAVRRQLGVVLQNSRVMSASIFENISSNALITMDEAWEAARMAGLADDIATMPMGMHTVVSEGGTNLSGGQRL